MTGALEIVFWVCIALIVWTQVGYAATLALLVRLLDPARGRRLPRGAAAPAPANGLTGAEGPEVSLIVAAHDEQDVIAAKVANSLALGYPRELIVVCDGCTDETAARARTAGADLVIELPRGGKVRAQDTAVEAAGGEILAFSDANSLWESDALAQLLDAFADPRVGYACGQVRLLGADEGTSQEGIYWRYEMALRENESRLCSITGGNGAIYAVRREAYMVVDPIMGHDLSFPFKMVKRGLRALYVPAAVASEKMVPSLEGEFARKRRMMSHTWPILVRGGMLSPRGYPPAYLVMILSHRVLRYLTFALHLLALAANVALLVEGAGALYVVTLVLQLALLGAAWLGGLVRSRILLVARYYVLTTASLAAGLWDWLAHGTPAAWDTAEGTR